ncbi:hypothetical protein BASA81_002248 [Batrachochytrium salamandrivorans]|nr:hypothetical protein BASA81_002248 [Batrachochytrium salamandrivorans]
MHLILLLGSLMAMGVTLAANSGDGFVSVYRGSCATASRSDVHVVSSKIPANTRCNLGSHDFGLQAVLDFRMDCSTGQGQVRMFAPGSDCTSPIDTQCADGMGKGLGLYHVFSCDLGAASPTLTPAPSSAMVPTTGPTSNVATKQPSPASAIVTGTLVPSKAITPSPTQTALDLSEGEEDPYGVYGGEEGEETSAPAPQTAIAYCSTQNGINQAACNTKIKKCANQYGIKMKWTGPGCTTASGIKYHDGGCQCDGYCGYNCKGRCNNDKACTWNDQAKLCLVKKTGAVGVGIRFSKEAKTALQAWTSNAKLSSFVDEYITLMKPTRVHFCDGSKEESDFLVRQMVQNGTLIPLNPELRPNSFLARSDPSDVARVEKQTLICAKTPEDVGPTNNWADIAETRADMKRRYDGCMQGRTMYVVPYSMGPVGSELSFNGIEITDAPYVVQSMKVMSRMGQAAKLDLEKRGDFVPGVHSVGAPLKPGQEDVPWPANKDKRITHFPDTSEILSYGSGYGGNALLGKKCFALRIAGYRAKQQGESMAEHMLIMCATNKKTNVKKYIAAAFPSACGKTNFAMMTSTLPDYKLETVGDDIAWMRFVNGKLHAINPEAGFFGVAPGTSMATNPNAMHSCERDTIFTNVAMTENADVWWEGMSKLTPGTRLTDWLRREWIAGETTTPAAHPNSRFCAPARNCPIMDSNWENPAGVPIDAIIFGGRRSTTIPLVYESRNWEHGTFLGATMGSEQTAAAEGQVGAFRPDPMAMIPFGSYNIGDYFQHWLNIGQKQGAVLPKIFFVNFFKKQNGQFIWPGFGENSRLIKWVCERTEGTGKGVESPIGILPQVGGEGGLDVSGLKLDDATIKELFKIEKKEWLQEVESYKKSLSGFGARVPKRLFAQLDILETNIKKL